MTDDGSGHVTLNETFPLRLPNMAVSHSTHDTSNSSAVKYSVPRLAEDTVRKFDSRNCKILAGRPCFLAIFLQFRALPVEILTKEFHMWIQAPNRYLGETANHETGGEGQGELFRNPKFPYEAKSCN